MKGQLIRVTGVGSVRVPAGSSKEVIQQAAHKLIESKLDLAQLQNQDTFLEGISPEGEVLYPVIDGETQEVTSEGRPIWENQYGEYVTERTIGVNIGGKEVNIPTVFNGQFLPIDEAIAKVQEASDGDVLQDPITGRVLEQYNSVAEANRGARDRSKSIGEDTPEYTEPSTDQEPRDEKEQLKFDEGVRYRSYVDTKGHLTAGVGHKLTKEEIKLYPEGTDIPKEIVDSWFEQDYTKAKTDVNRVLKSKEIENVPGEVHSILTNMVFNLGPTGLKKFKDTFGFIKRGDYQSASEEMLDSDWYREDVGPRAKRLSDRMAKVIEPVSSEDSSIDQLVKSQNPQPVPSPFEVPTPELADSLLAQERASEDVSTEPKQEPSPVGKPPERASQSLQEAAIQSIPDDLVAEAHPRSGNPTIVGQSLDNPPTLDEKIRSVANPY